MFRLFCGLVLFLELALSLNCRAQRSRYWQDKPGTWQISAGLGATRYAGDLNESGSLTRLRLGAAINGAITYRLSYRLSLRAEGQIYYIYGSQKDTRNFYNNLSFFSLNPDIWAGVQLDLWPVNHPTLGNAPYALLGAGLTYMRPRTTFEGKSYGLAELRTEGVSYNLFPPIIRYGMGMPVYTSHRIRVQLEGTYTHVLSDYLDDVSTVYVDQSTLTPLAAVLADRRAEIGWPLNRPGEQRGNSTRNDGYWVFSGRFVYVLSTPLYQNYRQKFGR
ncbi:hypothetical protein GGR92_002019 [Spirosoma lacussanchae]|uniref:hypothetical protein n=1 Tax=Spirosoma lacussanchae TaxID=1884249 RepID=UPI001FEA1C33|nr:hypothetical protein [Spirosoma lacussanchae]